MFLVTAYFANNWKCALVHPLHKKHGQLVSKSFSPVSSRRLIPKLKEKAVATQIQCHMVDSELLPCLQNA